MAEKIIIELDVNTLKGKKQIDDLSKSFNKLESSLTDVKESSDKTKESIDEVASNGGAIAILDQLTGGLATQFKNVYESTRLFNGSLKGTKTALIATGVGAFVVALGTIIAYWDEIVAFITKANEKLQKQIDLNKDNVTQLNFEIKLLDAKAKILDAEGKSTVEINKQKEKVLKLLLLENDQLITNLKTQLKRETSQAKELSFFQKLVQLRSNYKLIGEIDAEEKTRLDEINKSIQDATINAETLKLNLIEINKPDDKKKEEDKKKELAKKDTSVEDAEFANQEKINAIREKFRLQNEDAEDITEFEKLNRKYERDLLELERLGATEQQKLDLEAYYNSLRQTQFLENEDYLDQLEMDAEDERLKRLGEDALKEIEISKSISIAKEQIRQAEINNLEKGFQLLGQVAGKNKVLQAAALIGESAIGIAKIVINTQAANAAARLKYSLIPGGLALAAAEISANKIGAGIGIAANIAATAKGLSSLKASGSVPTAGGNSLSGGSGGGISQPPAFNVVGASNTNQLADAIGGQAQQPVKAYVVSNDVTTAQSMDRNIVSGASI